MTVAVSSTESGAVVTEIRSTSCSGVMISFSSLITSLANRLLRINST